VRLPDTDDPDLASITDGFNDMSAAVEERIERERRFAANVSHELRSPITAMMGTVDLIEPSLDSLPERDARLVGVLCGSVRRFNQVVLDLLEVSKVTAAPDLQVAEADIRDAVHNLLQSRAIPDRLLDGPEVRVFTDVRHLRRVIANLLDNARKHGEGVVRVVVEAHAGGARIYVDDAGPGIDPDDVARLFEPFNRGRGSERTDGAGLGLAIARTHATAISGALEVLRSPEGGARMQLTIPSLPPPSLPEDDWPEDDWPEGGRSAEGEAP
jgi:signal transduction histidine kinase